MGLYQEVYREKRGETMTQEEKPLTRREILIFALGLYIGVVLGYFVL